MLDCEGRIVGALEILTDISTLVWQQKNLLEQLVTRQQLIDAIPNPVFMMDSHGNCCACNKALMQYVGLGWEEIIGKQVEQLLPKELANNFKVTSLSGNEQTEIEVSELSVETPDGKTQHIICYKVPQIGKEPSSPIIVGVIIDVSELKYAKYTEIKNTMDWKHALQNTSIPVILLDHNCHIVAVNQEFCRLTGLSQSEVLGNNCFSLPWDDCNSKCSQFETLNNTTPIRKECGLRTKSYKYIRILKNENILKDEMGQITGALVSFIDVTNFIDSQRKVENALEQAEKLANTDELTGLLNRRAFF